MKEKIKNKILLLDFMRINADDFDDKKWNEIINKLKLNYTYIQFEEFIDDALSYFYQQNLFYKITQDLNLDGSEDIIRQITDLFSIKNAIMPNNIKIIKDAAFSKCTGLLNVKISENVTNIGYRAFSECFNLQSVTIPNSVKNIGDWAFSSCKNLENIIIPDGITSINHGTFFGCKNLESITIPNSVTNVVAWAFRGCKNLKNINAPDNIKQMILDQI